ncbi:hypothetical protein K469DRAFT_695094 [Zopfia rhizophila CBS 207.26]|uniref:Uncharacterized protein n=1 Tax=Zopfia rhizophila CBS 207.26 TaxID=1314779 RepID=A0A6A6DMU9_9PEZI|nr:hypothetical protein K469DRAFT_695094 [Zopfia rhizophila CBS 207.26]
MSIPRGAEQTSSSIYMKAPRIDRQTSSGTRRDMFKAITKIGGPEMVPTLRPAMSATDAGTRYGSSITLEALNETLGRVAATSSFSSIELRQRMETKYAEPIRTHDMLSRIFRRLFGYKGCHVCKECRDSRGGATLNNLQVRLAELCFAVEMDNAKAGLIRAGSDRITMF